MLMGNENSMALLPDTRWRTPSLSSCAQGQNRSPILFSLGRATCMTRSRPRRSPPGRLRCSCRRGSAAAIPISAGAVVGVALEVRNVITAENDTNLVRRITANLTNAFVQLKARHSTSQQTPIWRFNFPPGERDSGLADYSSTPAFVNLGSYVTQPKRCSDDLGPS